MIGVRDQYGFGRERTHLHDLPHHALCVDERLPDVHAVDDAAIEVEALAVRIEIDVEDLRDQRPTPDPRLRIEQFAQPRVLHLERREALQAELGVQLVALECLDLREQRLLGR
jgi:hypothetical protein